MSGPIEHPRYEDFGVISSGGMAEVRRVRDKVLGRVLAMKLIRTELLDDATAVARFRAEAEATAALQHPGIVPVHDLGEVAEGRLFFTMPEVRGTTLAQTIRQSYSDQREHGGRRLIEVIGRVARAVGFAHSKGVLHRDLKPENIMLGGHGEVLGRDWGIARFLERPDIAPDAADPDDEPSGIRTW